MKKVVLTYGLISGILVSLFMILTFNSGVEHLDSALGMFVGYLGMIVAFIFIFIAIKNYRDKLNGGAVTFGKAFRIGLFISLIASTFYVATWLVEYYYLIPDFMDKYAEKYISELRADGKPEAEIAQATREMAEYRELYKNPIFNAAITYMEILPVGILMSLLAAAILKRRPQPSL